MINKRVADYYLVEKIGRGGFGNVYKGQHVRLENRFVAVKMFMGVIDSDAQRDLFFQEAKLLDQIRHPHIIPVLDYGILDTSDTKLPYIITEFAPGGSLLDRLQQIDARLPLKQVFSILSQVGEALQFAHDRHILHNDLKPGNILFTNEDQALLADFGISVVLLSSLTKHGFFAGTLEYMAPEVFNGEASAKSDQYSLACMTYELLTGELPFHVSDPSKRTSLIYQHMSQQPRPPSSVNQKLPLAVDFVLFQALAKDRNDRYPDIKTFLQALQSALEDPPLRRTRRLPSHQARAASRSVPPRIREVPRIYDIEDDIESERFIYRNVPVFDEYPDISSIPPRRVIRRAPRRYELDEVDGVRPVLHQGRPRGKDQAFASPQKMQRPTHVPIPRNAPYARSHPQRKQSFFGWIYRWANILASPCLYLLALVTWVFFPHNLLSWIVALSTTFLFIYSLYVPIAHMYNKDQGWWSSGASLCLGCVLCGMCFAFLLQSIVIFFISPLPLIFLCSFYRFHWD